MENDLIRRSDAINEVRDNPFKMSMCASKEDCERMNFAAQLIENRLASIPAVDAVEVVERAVYEQVVWERDLAVKQLADIGKGLGEKMDDVAKVVRCRECKRWERLEFSPLHFCPGVHEFTDAEFFCKRGKRREEDHNAAD